MRIGLNKREIEEAMTIAEGIWRLNAEADMVEKLQEAYERGFRDGFREGQRQRGPMFPRRR